MYFTKLVALNHGGISKFVLNSSFNEDGRPKPMILVGPNGSGKTMVVSAIADSLVEFAANCFPNVTSYENVQRKYFKLLGGVNIKRGENFELILTSLVHAGDSFFYRAKAGNVTPASCSEFLTGFDPVSNWSDDQSNKVIFGDHDKIKKILNSGSYLFFPSNRSERPHWLTNEQVNEDSTFKSDFENLLRNPIVRTAGLEELKPWLIDVILDQAVDGVQILNAESLIEIKSIASQRYQFMQTYLAVCDIIKTILGVKQARLVRLHRGFGDRKITISTDQDIYIPSLNNLSSGQSILFSIFATILRYADSGANSVSLSDVEGLVIIDEIDAHLHIDLQYRALPELIAMFPKIQFVLTAHAPMFLLGMREKFGDEGFTAVEMPSGITISTERYSEFRHSMEKIKATSQLQNCDYALIFRPERE